MCLISTHHLIGENEWNEWTEMQKKKLHWLFSYLFLSFISLMLLWCRIFNSEFIFDDCIVFWSYVSFFLLHAPCRHRTHVCATTMGNKKKQKKKKTSGTIFHWQCQYDQFIQILLMQKCTFIFAIFRENKLAMMCVVHTAVFSIFI